MKKAIFVLAVSFALAGCDGCDGEGNTSDADATGVDAVADLGPDAAPMCAPDRFEGVEDFGGPVPITGQVGRTFEFEDLTLCPGDVDELFVDLRGDELWRVSVRGLEVGFDVTDQDGFVVASAVPVGDKLYEAVTDYLPAGRYTLTLSGEEGEYSVTSKISSSCDPDELEPNDLRYLATNLSPTAPNTPAIASDASLCAGDVDWYRAYNDGNGFSVIAINNENPEVTFQITDSSGKVVANALLIAPDPEDAEYNYFAVASVKDGQGDYYIKTTGEVAVYTLGVVDNPSMCEVDSDTLKGVGTLCAPGFLCDYDPMTFVGECEIDPNATAIP